MTGHRVELVIRLALPEISPDCRSSLTFNFVAGLERRFLKRPATGHNMAVRQQMSRCRVPTARSGAGGLNTRSCFHYEIIDLRGQRFITESLSSLKETLMILDKTPKTSIRFAQLSLCLPAG